MFASETYIERRRHLREQVPSGVLLLLGNDLSPMNFADNAYPFRQDSTFLYFFGIDEPGLVAVIDVDEGTEFLFGDDPTVDEVIWTGPQTPLRDKAERMGVTQTASSNDLAAILKKAAEQGRIVHFLPPYRAEHVLKISRLLSLPPKSVPNSSSEMLIRAVVAQRSMKSLEEIEQIEAALDISYEMHIAAMKLARPGLVEREVVGAMEKIVTTHGGRFAFAPIFSRHGETLHNPFHDNELKAGDIAVNDCGAESSLRYASDITRTIPIGGRFSQQQREIYAIVLEAQEKALAAVKPGVEFREIHRLACEILVTGLRDIGLLRGDPVEMVEAGVHALFFQCGLGHMMGLDVHDMENLGEEFVGYTDIIKKDPAFGWRSLRLGKALEPGYVVTVEPGVYFIPVLIDQWRAERKHESFINYDKVEAYRGFGGVRLEDDVLVTDSGCRLLGQPIPRTIAEVEALASQ